MTQRKIDNGNQTQPVSFGALFIIAVFVIMAIIGVVVIAIYIANQIGVANALLLI